MLECTSLVAAVATGVAAALTVLAGALTILAAASSLGTPTHLDIVYTYL